MSDTTTCPKCGRAVEAGAFICPGCEYILDTSFLGEDITDDERDKRKQTAPVGLKRTMENQAQANAPMNSVNFGEDAIILGNGQGEYSDFETKDAGMTREVTHARFYIGGNTAAILHIDAVPEIAPGILEGSLRMSPFERHVLGFINGKRSIGRIQKKSAMEDSEFKTSVAMLADKGIIRLRTTKKRKNKDGTSALPSRSEASAPVSAADRTVVASFEQISAEHERQSAAASVIAAAAALEDGVPSRAQVRGSRTAAPEPTIIKSSADPSRRKSAMGGPGFASVRLQEAAGDDHRPPPILVEDALADEWGADDAANNISNVFARAPSPSRRRGPSLADSPPIVSDRIEGAEEVRPPPLPSQTGDYEPVRPTKSAKTGVKDAPKLPALPRDASREEDDVVPAVEELVPPGGEDDFVRAKSEESLLLRAAAAADAAEDRQRTGPQTPQAAKARTTSPGGEAEPAFSAENAFDDDDGVPAALRDPTGIGDLKPVDLRGGEPEDDEASAFAANDEASAFADDDEASSFAGADPEVTAAAAELPQPSPAQAARARADVDDVDDEDADRSDDETFIKKKRRGEDDSAAHDDGDLPPTAPRPAVVERTAIPTRAEEPYTDDVPTGPLPVDDDDDAEADAEAADAAAEAADQDEIDADDDDQAFDVEMRTAHLERLSSANTASLPARDSIPNLPSDALQPLPSEPHGSPVAPRMPQAIPAPSMGAIGPPSMSLSPSMAQAVAPSPAPSMGPMGPPPSLPGQGRVPGLPGQSSSPPPALPGQHRAPTVAVPGLGVGGVGGGAGGAPGMGARPPTAVKGGLPVTRTSAGSKVPFEQARKAEKIFEQAMKDHAEGRISSARMNAKLAAMYDPSIETYQQFLNDLDKQGANAKPPGGGKPRELTLFEQASDAEGRGDFEKAIDLLEEAVSINPKAAALRNRLGVVLSIRLKRHTEALEQLRIAIELEPGNIVYMNNFSKVTALLDSQLEKGGLEENSKKKRGKKDDEKVQIKKMRPKMF